MNKFRLSLLVPTRDRTANIQRLIENIVTTAGNLNNIELLFACDSDDASSMYFINQQRNKYPSLNMKYYYRDRSEWLNRDYYNWLADKSSGEFCWLMGDDLIFTKQKWDITILAEIDKFLADKKDRILFVNVQSDTPNPPGIHYKFTGFPIISKEAIETVGFFMIPEIPSWCADYLLPLLYDNPKVKRALNIDGIFLSHISSHTQKILGDNVTYNLGLICNKYKSPELGQKWQKEKLPIVIDRLALYIADIKDPTSAEKRQKEEKVIKISMKNDKKKTWDKKIEELKDYKRIHENMFIISIETIQFQIIDLEDELTKLSPADLKIRKEDRLGKIRTLKTKKKELEDLMNEVLDIFNNHIKMFTM